MKPTLPTQRIGPQEWIRTIILISHIEQVFPIKLPSGKIWWQPSESNRAQTNFTDSLVTLTRDCQYNTLRVLQELITLRSLSRVSWIGVHLRLVLLLIQWLDSSLKKGMEGFKPSPLYGIPIKHTCHHTTPHIKYEKHSLIVLAIFLWLILKVF